MDLLADLFPVFYKLGVAYLLSNLHVSDVLCSRENAGWLLYVSLLSRDVIFL